MSHPRAACTFALVSGLAACSMDQLYEVHVTRDAGGRSGGGGASGASAVSTPTASVGAGGAGGSSGVGSGGGGAAGPFVTAGAAGAAGASGVAGSTTSSGVGGSAGGGGAAGLAPVLDASLDAAVDAGGDGSTPTCAGQALLLEGLNYIEVARPIQDDFTLEAWVKTTASRSGAMWYQGNGLFYADVGGAANDFGSSILNDRFAFGVGNPDTTISSSSIVTTGLWVHVAATRRKSTGEIQVFVNGALESAMTTTQTGSLTAQATLAVGANTIDGLYFLGAIDEVRLWSVVRSPSEIASSLHTRVTGAEAGLVGYYRFDEEDGPMALDTSTNQKTAILVGGSNRARSEAPMCP